MRALLNPQERMAASHTMNTTMAEDKPTRRWHIPEMCDSTQVGDSPLSASPTCAPCHSANVSHRSYTASAVGGAQDESPLQPPAMSGATLQSGLVFPIHLSSCPRTVKSAPNSAMLEGVEPVLSAPTMRKGMLKDVLHLSQRFPSSSSPMGASPNSFTRQIQAAPPSEIDPWEAARLDLQSGQVSLLRSSSSSSNRRRSVTSVKSTAHPLKVPGIHVSLQDIAKGHTSPRRLLASPESVYFSAESSVEDDGDDVDARKVDIQLV